MSSSVETDSTTAFYKSKQSSVTTHQRPATLNNSSTTLLDTSSPPPLPSTSSSSTTLFSNQSPSPTSLLKEKLLSTKKSEEQDPDFIASGKSIRDYINTFNWQTAYNLGRSNNTLHYYQLPFPWRENRYIIKGYRFYDSNVKCLLSVVNYYGWHNETLNIWSHLGGFLTLLYIAVFVYPNTEVYQSELIPTTAKMLLFVFLIAGMKCMLASVFWHTFDGTCSYTLRPKFCCVDYTGITILITASILTAEYVSLSHAPIWMFIYMSLSLALGTFGVYINWSPKFDGPEARPLRIKFFVTLSAMGCLSFVHLIFTTSLRHACWLLAPIISKSTIWYVIGVFFYGSFIPEKYRSDYILDKTIPTSKQLSCDLSIITKDRHIHFRDQPTPNKNGPRKTGLRSLWWVDYVGQSHTIWHIFVLLGVVGHYKACLDMFTKQWLIN
ncbi:hypothetical protein TBLA_0C06050 [Henningerozyma blattae CBS 6284]|uniref:Uncharacterized protein n=1 Tax=Henningerozyma blattae (strain ATCC 34711 / CBS 6284 / DSM 70876 / NBRC 10599 / NRRL Y-10934 / UCD 77-7) TaxID=1071380 RepID=I2H200_HENB6|nr:hypothetical protein TBLA_0C06050 [Tetrapisispora blattae CBS 6284]CCH60402.1 hypothetical protein TBLA_0C06050 [Tetrapisispora blattae CBS 6284]